MRAATHCTTTSIQLPGNKLHSLSIDLSINRTMCSRVFPESKFLEFHLPALLPQLTRNSDPFHHNARHIVQSHSLRRVPPLPNSKIPQALTSSQSDSHPPFSQSQLPPSPHQQGQYGSQLCLQTGLPMIWTYHQVYWSFMQLPVKVARETLVGQGVGLMVRSVDVVVLG
jgi:hypothetical protein